MIYFILLLFNFYFRISLLNERINECTKMAPNVNPKMTPNINPKSSISSKGLNIPRVKTYCSIRSGTYTPGCCAYCSHNT